MGIGVCQVRAGNTKRKEEALAKIDLLQKGIARFEALQAS
jgi:hypothetical protein